MFIDILFGFVWNWGKERINKLRGKNGQFLNICAVLVWYMDTERYAHPMDAPPDNSRSY